MIDQETENEILKFVREESLRLGYGKLLITISVVDKNVVDIEIETKRRKHL